MNPTREEIAARAYQLWEKDGRKPGQDSNYWLQAENELFGTRPSAKPAMITPSASAASAPASKPATKRSRAQAR